MTAIEDTDRVVDILSQFENVKLKKINYYSIPVTALNFTEEHVEVFNSIVSWLEGMEFFKIVRTPSGGICTDKGKGAYWPAFDVRKKPTGVELTIISNAYGCYRIQMRNSSSDLFEENKMKINGKTAFYKFKDVCKQFNIDLKDYMETDKEKCKQNKESIEDAKVCFTNMMIENTMLHGNKGKPSTLNNMFHIDFHSSYMSGLVNTHHEFKDVVNHIYEKRKEDNGYYKAILNMTQGYMQSYLCGCRWAHLSRDMIHDNNRRIDELTKDLRDSGMRPILYNTDGIWYYSPSGKPYHGKGEGKGIGTWENDHLNCKFRCKSKGCYEYIEDGIYHPVVRGLTKYDKIKPDRTTWEWGDIFKEETDIITFKLKGNYLYMDDELKGVTKYEEI